MKVSILIIAAGNSSRLGHPKQLVVFQGKTLIERTVEIALSVSEEVLVVLGANNDYIEEQISGFWGNAKTIFNPEWQQGMGTSIRVGTEQLVEKSDAILILLSDQPFISKVLLQKMVQTFADTQNPIVTCWYKNQHGVPMLFDKSVFPELLKLSGDKGAKSFLKLYEDRISWVDFPAGDFDIDTPEDLVNLQNLDV